MRRKDGRPQNRPRRYPYGVSWRAKPKPYIVKFKRNKRTVYVGSFATLAEATEAAFNFLIQEIPYDTANIA